jgi:hypothetical protein
MYIRVCVFVCVCVCVYTHTHTHTHTQVNELVTTPEDKALLSPQLLEVLEKADELKHAHQDNHKHITFIEKVTPKP